MLRLSAIALALLLAAPALAGTLPELRAGVASAESRLGGARSRRLEVERALDETAKRIEVLKADRGQGALFRDAELETLLRKSQELSGKLTELMQAERAAEEALRGSQSQLVSELDGELARMRAAWDSGSREQRQTLVARMKALRGERESLRGALPATAVPQLSSRATDDPEELLMRADALLDSEDKLRREERALAARIAELKQERELEQRMSDFLSEGSLFDEHDRRISINRPGRQAASEATNSAPANPQTGGTDNGGGSKTDGIPPGGDVRTETGPDGQPTDWNEVGESGTGSFGTAVPGPSTTPEPGRQPSLGQVGDDGARRGISRMPPERHGALQPFSEDETLEELEARRAQLKALADDLHRKADETAAKARDLQ